MTAQTSADQRRDQTAPAVSTSISQAAPSDPVFVQQWHLDNRVSGLLDLNVLTAWNDYTGQGIRAFVLDDGFDYNHTDLAPNYNTALDLDLEGGDNNPAPVFAADSHGTACMGILGADRNGSGAVGVAYDAELVGIRAYSDDAASSTTFDSYVANLGLGITHAATNGGDVISMSNGTAGGNNYFDQFLNASIVNETMRQIEDAAANGRDGLGLNMVKAAGNSRDDGWDTNMSAIDNMGEIISVAAVDQNGFVSSYSSPGAAILVSGFGTPGQVVTTDRTGAPGYAPGNITSGFNGTSAATPMVSGVIALMLDANEGLGWRDVQAILANSAVVVGSGLFGGAPSGFESDIWTTNGAEGWNGGGMMFSNDYGFGLVDATAAVRLAESWFLGGQAARTSANQSVVSNDMVDAPRQIPDANPEGVTVAGSFFSDPNFQIEYTTVTITMGPNHSFMGDLVITLTSSSGVTSILHNRTGDGTNFPGEWTFMTRAFNGENATGTWAVSVIDTASGDTGTLTDLVVEHHGQSSADDAHVFTNQYSDFADEAGRNTVTDTNGGIDTVNAAAVTSASRINLNGGTSSIDGVTLTISTEIENAIGGDGGDTLTGNGADNRLFGMRGLDRISGGSGNDLINGGSGNDTMLGGSGDDIYVVDTTGDRVYETRSITSTTDAGGLDTVQSSVTFTLDGNAGVRFVEQLTLTGRGAINGTGNALNNTLTGNNGANTLNGGNGNDTLSGSGGADTLLGGSGQDRLIGGGRNDALTGGGGADSFVFRAGSSGVDVISDFNQLNGGGEEGDVLRFEGLGGAGFVYLGSGEFTGGSDNAEARVSGNRVLVDTNGDGVTDITIALTGLTNANQLSTDDFLFV